MFPEFTDAAHSIFAAALRESDAYRHDHVGTGHLLLGLLGVGEAAAPILSDLGAEQEAIASFVRAELVPGGRTEPMAERPYSARAAAAIERMIGAVREFGDPAIAPEHILLALAGVADSLSARALASCGVPEEKVVREIRRRRGAAP